MGNIIPSHHMIFTPENPAHPTKYGKNPSIEDVTKFLNDSGEQAQIMEGHYDAPERSILVSHPKNPKGIFQMAKDFGQDSLIHSKDGKHELHYTNGPNEGKIVHGEGTSIFKEKPENYYSTLHTVDGPVHFQHNFNFDEINKFESLQGAEDHPKYNIHQDGQRISSEPMTVKQIQDKHKKTIPQLESKGFKLIEHKEKLRKSPIPYTAYDPKDAPDLRNMEDSQGEFKRVKEVKLPNGLLYRQYIKPKHDEPMSQARHHALYDPSGNIPLAIMHTKHEEDPMTEGGFHPHKVTWSEVDKDYRGKGLGRQMYLAALVHGTKRLTSDSAISPEAHKAWQSMKGIPGLGGKIGKYLSPDDLASGKGDIGSHSNDRHQVFIRDQSKLDHAKMFPKVDLDESLAASEKDLGYLKKLLESPEIEDSVDIPEHLQIQWAVPIHRWNDG